MSGIAAQFRDLELYVERSFNLLSALVALAFVVCAMSLPVTLLPTAAHDDGLFFRLAYSVVQGNWLGDYGETTLAKGPTFPFFLAVNAVIGLPITLSLALFYAFSCWLLTSRLTQLKVPSVLALGLLVLLLFHPHSFPTRIIRDNIYPALTLIVLAATVDTFFAQAASRVDIGSLRYCRRFPMDDEGGGGLGYAGSIAACYDRFRSDLSGGGPARHLRIIL